MRAHVLLGLLCVVAGGCFLGGICDDTDSDDVLPDVKREVRETASDVKRCLASSKTPWKEGVLDAGALARCDRRITENRCYKRGAQDNCLEDRLGYPLHFVYRNDSGLVYSVGPNGIDEKGNGDDIGCPLR
jgi:hypothetical protein